MILSNFETNYQEKKRVISRHILKLMRIRQQVDNSHILKPFNAKMSNQINKNSGSWKRKYREGLRD